MPTPLTHGFVALVAGKTLMRRKMPLRFWGAAVVCSALPDLDTLGFRFGIAYGDVLGHRGLFHSLPFALLVSLVTMAVVFRGVQAFSKRGWGLWAFFFLVSASHGLLDALTNGGLGIAFFAPFDNTRYFLPWRPIQVAPIGLGHMLSPWGLRVIASELLWVWLPAAALLAVVTAFRAAGRAWVKTRRLEKSEP